MVFSSLRCAPPAFAALLALAGAAAQPAAGATLHASLTGAAERPGPGDPGGSGAATLRVDPAAAQICYDLLVRGIAPATTAQIHRAPPAESGPPLARLEPPGPGGSSSGCVSATPGLLTDLLDNPAAYYVDVRNDEYKDGALRGQLGR